MGSRDRIPDEVLKEIFPKKLSRNLSSEQIYTQLKGTYVIPSPDKKDIARIVDVSTAMTRAVAVLGATLLVSIALKDKKGTRTQSPMDREPCLAGRCQENERQLVKKDIVAKILRFLKEFF